MNAAQAIQKSLKISELRELIARKEGNLPQNRLPSSSVACGIPKGAITEIAGNAQIEWVAQFLKENPSLKVFWMERRFTLFPPALYQRGLHPGRFLFAECGEDLFPCLRTALRCQVFECVISPNQFSEERILKALQLQTEKANVVLILLSQQLASSWPISLQFEVQQPPHSPTHAHTLTVTLKKNKGGRKFTEGLPE